MNRDGAPTDNDERETDDVRDVLVRALSGPCWTALRASRYRDAHSSLWASLVFVIEPGEAPHIELRVQLASHLHHAGVESLAREATRRSCPRGSMLAYIVAEDDAGAGVAFYTVPIFPSSAQRGARRR